MSLRSVRTVIAIVVLSVAGSLHAQGGGAETFPWKWRKALVGKEPAQGSAPSSAVAVDAAGHPHMIYGVAAPDYTTSHQFVLTHAWSDGKSWLSEPIGAPTNFESDLAVAVGDDGTLHVAYVIWVPGPLLFTSIRQLCYATNLGGAWSSEVLEVTDWKAGPGLAVDAAGVVHIVHVAPLNTARHLWLSAGRWEGESFEPTWVGGYSRPAVVVDGDALRVVYQASPTPEIITLRLATLEAGSWSFEDIVDGQIASAAVGENGVLHVTYRPNAIQDQSLCHAWRTEQGWQTEVLVNQPEHSIFGQELHGGVGVSGGVSFLETDAAGRLRLAAKISLSKGEESGPNGYIVSATLENGLWVVRGAKWVGYGGPSDSAISPGGIVHLAVIKETAFVRKTVDFAIKGKRLTLMVDPPEAGAIANALTGQECTSKTIEEIYRGEVVNLSATAAEGFTFAGWSGAASGTDPECTVTMNGARKVVARFVPTP